MQRKLLYYPDPILRQKTHAVRQFSTDLNRLSSDMRQIMKQNNGMGLAAIQVGDLRRVIIVELPADPKHNEPGIPFTVLINPKITKLGSKTDTVQEGCLSVPAVEVAIERVTEITVTALSVIGKPIKIRAKGLFARILQHEIDHLNNKLILDYVKAKPKANQTIRTQVWGSTAFTTQFLNTIFNNPSLEITHLVTEAPKPSGRGRQVTPTLVRQYADTLGIPCLEPENLNDPRFISYLATLKPDLILVAAYGKLLPPSILNLPTYGCLNIHPSLLPRYRGATPIQASILNGDRTTGVTLMRMAPQFDTGAMLARAELELNGTETYRDLEPILAESGGEIVNQVLPRYIAGELIEQPQAVDKASTTKKITALDRWLNLDEPATRNERKIRAYTPDAFVVVAGQPMKIIQAHCEGDKLVFDMVQPAGKKPMPWADFLRGYRKPLHFQPYQAILSKDKTGE